MADDWQVGDLALCVVNSGPQVDPWEPVAGGIYTVSGIGCTLRRQRWLNFEEDPTAYPNGGWNMFWFRKIRPHEADEEDRETIRLLNGAPVKEPAQ